jgi:hypothetical protein
MYIDMLSMDGRYLAGVEALNFARRLGIEKELRESKGDTITFSGCTLRLTAYEAEDLGIPHKDTGYSIKSLSLVTREEIEPRVMPGHLEIQLKLTPARFVSLIWDSKFLRNEEELVRKNNEVEALRHDCQLLIDRNALLERRIIEIANINNQGGPSSRKKVREIINSL